MTPSENLVGLAELADRVDHDQGNHGRHPGTRSAG